MKRDTTSSSLRFSDEPGDEPEAEDTSSESTSDRESFDKRVVLAVGIAAAAAAIAAGIYAAWLLKKRDAESVISDVQDLVQSCEERFAEIETELKRIGS